MLPRFVVKADLVLLSGSASVSKLCHAIGSTRDSGNHASQCGTRLIVNSSAEIHMSVVDYPANWKRVAHTRDGIEYRIRPIRADDLPRDREFIMGLSQESRYTRMMYTMREPSAALLEQFVHVDYHRNMAFVGVVGELEDEHIIGVARYAADTNGPDGEFAVAVADGWQARGVGATLTRLLFDYARTQGFHKLHGDVLVSNHRMVELVRWLGMKTQRRPDDGTLLEASRAP